MWFSEMMIVNHIKVNNITVLSNECCLRLFNYYLIHFKFSISTLDIPGMKSDTIKSYLPNVTQQLETFLLFIILLLFPSICLNRINLFLYKMNAFLELWDGWGYQDGKTGIIQSQYLPSPTYVFYYSLF